MSTGLKSEHCGRGSPGSVLQRSSRTSRLGEVQLKNLDVNRQDKSREAADFQSRWLQRGLRRPHPNQQPLSLDTADIGFETQETSDRLTMSGLITARCRVHYFGCEAVLMRWGWLLEEGWVVAD